MQTLGYIIDKNNGDKIKILVRQNKQFRYFRLRKGGKDGIRFIDEEIYLNSEGQINKLIKLKNNETIIC